MPKIYTPEELAKPFEDEDIMFRPLAERIPGYPSSHLEDVMFSSVAPAATVMDRIAMGGGSTFRPQVSTSILEDYIRDRASLIEAPTPVQYHRIQQPVDVGFWGESQNNDDYDLSNTLIDDGSILSDMSMHTLTNTIVTGYTAPSQLTHQETISGATGITGESRGTDPVSIHTLYSSLADNAGGQRVLLEEAQNEIEMLHRINIQNAYGDVVMDVVGTDAYVESLTNTLQDTKVYNAIVFNRGVTLETQKSKILVPWGYGKYYKKNVKKTPYDIMYPNSSGNCFIESLVSCLQNPLKPRSSTVELLNKIRLIPQSRNDYLIGNKSSKYRSTGIELSTLTTSRTTDNKQVKYPECYTSRSGLGYYVPDECDEDDPEEVADLIAHLMERIYYMLCYEQTRECSYSMLDKSISLESRELLHQNQIQGCERYHTTKKLNTQHTRIIQETKEKLDSKINKYRQSLETDNTLNPPVETSLVNTLVNPLVQNEQSDTVSESSTLIAPSGSLQRDSIKQRPLLIHKHMGLLHKEQDTQSIINSLQFTLHQEIVMTNKKSRNQLGTNSVPDHHLVVPAGTIADWEAKEILEQVNDLCIDRKKQLFEHPYECYDNIMSVIVADGMNQYSNPIDFIRPRFNILRYDDLTVEAQNEYGYLFSPDKVPMLDDKSVNAEIRRFYQDTKPGSILPKPKPAIDSINNCRSNALAPLFNYNPRVTPFTNLHIVITDMITKPESFNVHNAMKLANRFIDFDEYRMFVNQMEGLLGAKNYTTTAYMTRDIERIIEKYQTHPHTNTDCTPSTVTSNIKLSNRLLRTFTKADRSTLKDTTDHTRHPTIPWECTDASPQSLLCAQCLVAIQRKTIRILQDAGINIDVIYANHIHGTDLPYEYLLCYDAQSHMGFVVPKEL